MSTMLANRLQKRFRHLRKWASRNDISCYRLYERDIPEYPLIVDWYHGEAVVWLYERSKEDDEAWHDDALEQIQAALELSPRQIFVKTRAVQRGLQQQYERFGQQGHVADFCEDPRRAAWPPAAVRALWPARSRRRFL